MPATSLPPFAILASTIPTAMTALVVRGGAAR